MKLRPALLTCLFVLGCAETDYGNLGNSSGAGAGSSGASGTGAGTTTVGNGGAPGSSSGSGAGTTSSTGSGGAPGTSSSSGAGGAGTSSGGTGGDPYDTPPTCSSMTMAPGGNNAYMQPGTPCKKCHVLFGQASGKTFDIGGTVYLTAHEPDNCNGVNVSGAVVVITDANNVETQLSVNSAGNFYHNDGFGFLGFKTPLHARVQYNGQVRKMVGAITNGDCNSCHTENGDMSAPGRIMLP